MNKIIKFLMRIKLKRSIRSLSTEGVEYLVNVLLRRSIYVNGDKQYTTLVDYVKSNNYIDSLNDVEIMGKLVLYKSDILLEALSGITIKSEKLSKLLRLCSTRRIKNPVILALTVEE